MKSCRQHDLAAKENLDEIQKKLRKQLSTAELPGVSAIVNSRGYIRKIAKLMIVIFGVAGFGYQTFKFLDIYWQYLTISTVSKLDKMEKPAITICDKNIVSSDYLCQYMKLGEKCVNVTEFSLKCKADNVNPFCIPSDMNYKKVLNERDFQFHDDYYDIKFTEAAGFNLRDMLLLCQWTYREIKDTTHEVIRNCSLPKFMRGVTKDKYPGACYTINSAVANSDYAADYFDGDSGLTMTLKWNLHDLIFPPLIHNKLRSYIISIHSPEKFSNPFVDGFEVMQGNHYNIRVSQGCEKKCEIDECFATYGCVPYYVTRPHDKPLCVNVKRNDFILENAIDACIQNCRDACRETEYFATVSFSRKLDLNDIYEKYKTPLVMTLQFLFLVSNSTAVIERPVYQTVEVFSYIGGFMGIWLGWSLAAIFELVDIFVSAIVNYLYLKYSN